MTDEAAGASGPRFKIRITKAKKDLDIAWNELPPEVQMWLVEQGLSKVLNGATSKVTAANTPDENSRGEQAMGLAQKKLDALRDGKFKRSSKSDGKVPGVVMTEARRLAKTVIKAQIKAKGKKISDYEAKAITEAANTYLAAHPELVEQARASVDANAKIAEAAAVDVSAIPVSDKRVQAREKANAEKRAETAAKSAGKPGGQKSALKAKAPVPAKRTAPQATA